MERSRRQVRNQTIPEGGTVTVALKLPNGLMLQIFEFQSFSEPVMGGGVRDSKIARPNGQKPVKLYGNRFPFGIIPPCKIINGYALTENVSAELFARWLKDNEDSDLVQNGLIYASDKEGNTLGWIKEHKDTKSGLEPLDPKNDYRAPRSLNRNVKVEGGVEAE